MRMSPAAFTVAPVLRVMSLPNIWRLLNPDKVPDIEMFSLVTTKVGVMIEPDPLAVKFRLELAELITTQHPDAESSPSLLKARLPDRSSVEIPMQHVEEILPVLSKSEVFMFISNPAWIVALLATLPAYI